MSRTHPLLPIGSLALVALLAAPSANASKRERERGQDHRQSQFEAEQNFAQRGPSRDRDRRGQRGFDQRGFGQDRCFRFVLGEYKTIYSGSYALERTKRFCRDDFSFRVFKTAYRAYSNYGTYYRLDSAKRFARRNPNLGVRDDLFRFTLTQMQQNYSGSYALDSATRMIRRFPRAQSGCVQQVFGEFRQNYSANYALERSFKFCSDDSPRRRHGRRGNRNSRRGW